MTRHVERLIEYGAAVMVGVVAVVLLALWWSDPADAVESDTRHCVTQHELWTAPGRLSREQVERRWDTHGRGERADITFIDIGTVWLYPMCDRSARAFVGFRPGVGAWIYGLVNE